MQFKNLIEFTHPLIQHKITIMRDKNTGTNLFRQLVKEVGMLMTYEITKDLPLKEVEIETPICKMTAKEISGKKLAIVPILRAGLGMVEGLVDIIPSAKVGHIGLQRNEETLQPVEYYCKLPQDIKNRTVLLVDPMLATGGSASAALTVLKEKGIKDIKLVVLIAAPEGIQFIEEQHPDIKIYAGTVDEKLNEKGYIVPGLGDAGDRIFGT